MEGIPVDDPDAHYYLTRWFAQLWLYDGDARLIGQFPAAATTGRQPPGYPGLKVPPSTTYACLAFFTGRQMSERLAHGAGEPGPAGLLAGFCNNLDIFIDASMKRWLCVTTPRESTMTTTHATPNVTVRTLLSAIDAGDVDTIGTLIADNVCFRFGNADPTDTKADFAATAQAFLRSLAGIRHDIQDLWEVGDGTVVCVMDVHYRRRDGRELTLPCCNVFRVRDGLVHDYRIYMDVNPVTGP